MTWATPLYRKNAQVDYAKVALTALGVLFTFAFGANHEALLILLMMVCMDYATGFLAAVVLQRVNSKTGLRGIAKKTGLLFLVSLGHMTDRMLELNGLVLNICVIFIFANEGVSIIENLALMGVPVPAKLTNVLEQLREKDAE